MTEMLNADETGSERTYILEAIDADFTKFIQEKVIRVVIPTVKDMMANCACTSYFNLEVFAYQDPTISADDLFILHVVGVILRALLEDDLQSLVRL